MKTRIKKIINIKNYFNIISETVDNIVYTLKSPSILLVNNVYINWLQFLLSKTHKHTIVHTHNEYAKLNLKSYTVPFGYLDNTLVKYSKTTILEQTYNCYNPRNISRLNFNMIVPSQDKMQYFIQWQRYRKFWWSSITTTPSLFAINEINYENDTAAANIVANFPWGPQIVEHVTISSTADIINDCKVANLICATSLETALFTLLLDGLNNNSEERYLRINRSMAPFKISFALNSQDAAKKQTLCDLAKLMYYKLRKNNISSLLPNFTLGIEQQVEDNLQHAVAYTVVLCDETLSSGIFHLLNSNTMLKEQVHLADFDHYASLLCNS